MGIRTRDPRNKVAVDVVLDHTDTGIYLKNTENLNLFLSLYLPSGFQLRVLNSFPSELLAVYFSLYVAMANLLIN
jgi:hypothetical protein